MAVGYGALWAPVWNFHSQQFELFEVPNEGNRHPKVIPGLGGPVEVGGGSIWATSGSYIHPSIVRVDPTTHDVMASVGLPSVPVVDAAFAGASLWVIARDQGVDNVYRIDSATNEIVLNARIPFPGRAYSVVADTSGAWVSVYGSGLVHVGLDGTFEKPVAEGGIAAFAYAGGRIWSLGPPGTLYELDLQTGRIDK